MRAEFGLSSGYMDMIMKLTYMCVYETIKKYNNFKTEKKVETKHDIIFKGMSTIQVMKHKLETWHGKSRILEDQNIGGTPRIHV